MRNAIVVRGPRERWRCGTSWNERSNFVGESSGGSEGRFAWRCCGVERFGWTVREIGQVLTESTVLLLRKSERVSQ